MESWEKCGGAFQNISTKVQCIWYIRLASWRKWVQICILSILDIFRISVAPGWVLFPVTTNLIFLSFQTDLRTQYCIWILLDIRYGFLSTPSSVSTFWISVQPPLVSWSRKVQVSVKSAKVRIWPLPVMGLRGYREPKHKTQLTVGRNKVRGSSG